MIDRRRFLPAIAATLAGCGDAVRRVAEPEPQREPCPTCGPKDRPVRPEPEPEPPPVVVPDPPSWPVVGIEHLATLSQRDSDPAECVRIVAEHGIQLYRTFTVLARWGGGREDQPPRGWFCHPLDHEAEFFDRFRAWDDACARHGLIAMPCLFDDPLRWRPEREPWVTEALRDEVIDVASAGTWLDEGDSDWAAAEGLLRFYTGDFEPAPHRVWEATNEPGDWPAGWTRPPDDRIAEWLRARGHRVARGTRFGDDGPYRGAEVAWEHAWGRPGVQQPSPPYDRLDALQRAHPDVHIGYSTDGFGIEDYPEEAAKAGDVIARGYSFAGLVRTAPDRWTDEMRRAVDRMVASAERARRAA